MRLAIKLKRSASVSISSPVLISMRWARSPSPSFSAPICRRWIGTTTPGEQRSADAGQQQAQAEQCPGLDQRTIDRR